jgi:hypothetical protein
MGSGDVGVAISSGKRQQKTREKCRSGDRSGEGGDGKTRETAIFRYGWWLRHTLAARAEASNDFVDGRRL